MGKLIIIRGIPGSGKSTLAKTLATAFNGAVFEADAFFMKDGQYVWDRDKISAAHRWCIGATKAHLSVNGTAIVSNTFTTIKELSPYFDIAKENGIVPVVYVCQNDWGSIHNVPQETIEAMKSRFVYDISQLFKELE